MRLTSFAGSGWTQVYANGNIVLGFLTLLHGENAIGTHMAADKQTKSFFNDRNWEKPQQIVNVFGGKVLGNTPNTSSQ